MLQSPYIVDDYGYQTGRIQDQTYGNGDMISFEYNEDNQISTIIFTGYQETEITKFQYQYDSFGRVSVYEDVTNGITEYYEYNMSGKLSKITDNLGNEILYDYDEEGNLNSVNVSFDTLEMESNFDYDNPINSDFYDQTWYNNGNSTIYKDYIYESSGLQRLDHIDYLNGTFNFMDYELTYQIDKTRITTITYDFYYSYADISYVYTYDSLGNVTSEVYQENGVTKVAKEYLYDEFNQLIQESVEDTRVDCTSTANIDVCYVKTFDYDINGNITSQKTFKFVDTDSLVVEKEVTAYQTNNGTYSMYVLYNNHSYSYEYALNVGDNISITYQYFEWGSWPPELLGGISTSYDYSGVDTLTPGFYLIEANGHNALYTYDLDFGIVVNVGDVVAGTLVNEVTYTYDTTWKDQLDSYTVYTNGISKTSNITYDDSGNPEGITNFYYEGTKYNHAVLSWDGRQLTSIEIYSSSDNSTLIAEIWYTYNDQGIRTSKIIDDGTMIKYQYVLSGDTVLAEIVKEYNDATEEWELLYQIAYSYDYDGSLIGFTYDTGTSKTDYIYIKNQQGDITRIVTTSGSTRVIYQYDAYGNITDISGTYASTIGRYNSFRYRSYKYDSEINLYYLNSRYYNSEIARFISADGMLSDLNNALSQNQYSYCGNNPISRNDEQGEFWHIIAGAAIGAILGGVVSYVKTGSVDWQMVAAGAVTGALVAAGGAMVVSAIQTGGAAVAGYIALNAGSSVLAQIEANGVNGDPFNKNLIGAAVGGAIGSIAKGWAPGIAALATAGINEFSNEIFWDDDDEIYSWKEVGIEAGAYAASNYTSYLINIGCKNLGLSRGSRESTVAAANFILDLIAILFSEEIK